MLKRLYWVLSTQFGIQPLQTLRGLGAVPSYISDWVRFRQRFEGHVEMMPCLHNRREQSGDASSEYFIQDLEVAKRVFSRNPQCHVDVGSRVDGFVAHVASFRTIEVLDIRPTQATIGGIVFKQADLMNVETSPSNYCDSLSCLHAIEHFGLGRYGDRLDPDGWKLGIAGLSRILEPGGRLYLSTPVGIEKVMFNAHRVFFPQTIVDVAAQNNLTLDNLSWISGAGIETSRNVDHDMKALAAKNYSLGIFEFLKT